VRDRNEKDLRDLYIINCNIIVMRSTIYIEENIIYNNNNTGRVYIEDDDAKKKLVVEKEERECRPI